jgi:hypothetical protein
MTLTEAVDAADREARLAYGFNANSYTYGALTACLAAQAALDRTEAIGERSSAPGRGEEAA